MYSQFQEDMWIWENVSLPEHGFFIDVGAFKAKEMSNSYLFESRGWDGICVEADPALYEDLALERKRVLNYAVADFLGTAPFYKGIIPDWNSLIKKDETPDDFIEVKVITLDEIIKREKVERIDLLSIDVEGAELAVLKGLTKIKPSLIIIEHTHNAVHTIADYLHTDYRLIHVTTANLIYELRR